ncbi:MAG TPA: hypothetical protein VK137_03565, partial [Planctomycetaceae bacterium]|nr:hypothetical protein [Planctomycetaceae bacterium]
MIDKARAVARAEIELLEGDVRTQEIRVGRLTKLHADGYASWLELATARLQFARNTARVGAALGLATDIESLRQRVPGDGDADASVLPSDVVALVDDTLPAQAGVRVLRTRDAELVQSIWERHAQQFDARTPHVSVTMRPQVRSALFARQRAVDELRQVEQVWIERSRQQLQDAPTSAAGVRVVWIGGGREIV